MDFHNTQSLGLELVHLLVGQINGTIDLAVNGGTTFTITFPAES
jgi:two-component sensor histidine kinase